MANENPSTNPANAGKNFEGNLGPVEIAKRRQKQREATREATIFERRVDQLAKSPEITSQLGKIRESALRTTDSVKSGESLKSLTDNINEVRDEIKTKGSSEDLIQELAQLKAEQTIWETRHQELVTAKTEARVAKAKERTAKIMSELEAQKNIPAPPELPPRDESPVYEENEPEIITDVEDLEDVEEPTEEIAKSTIQQEIAPATQTVELPKKSWIPAGLRKWGLAALALVGIGTAVHEAAPHLKTIGDEATTTVDYAANATASEANREKGLRDAANAARRVEYVRDRALAGVEKTTQEKAAGLTAGETVEIGGETISKTTPTRATAEKTGAEPMKIGYADTAGYRSLLASELRVANALDIPELRKTVLGEQIRLFKQQRKEKQGDLQIALSVLNAGIEGPRIEETKKAVAEYVGRQAAMEVALENLQALDEVEREAKLASVQKDLDKLIEKRDNLNWAVKNLNTSLDLKGQTEELLSGEEIEISGKKVRLNTSDLNS